MSWLAVSIFDLGEPRSKFPLSTLGYTKLPVSHLT